jgi:hypothetical protein
MDGIFREGVPNQSYLTGLGYIILPADQDRDVYIETCYRKERVTIQLDNGGSVIQNCYIDQDKLQKIKFPEDYKGLGSIVAYICDRFVRKPIIIGVLSDRGYSQLLEENSFQKVVRSDNGTVSIEGKGKDGNLYINVESDYEDGGSIFITLKSLNNTSKFDVKCFGDINIYSEGEATLNTLKTATITASYVEDKEEKFASKVVISQDGLLYEDKNDNKIEIINEEINVIPKTKFNVFSGGEPMVLGDELKKQLEIVTDRLDNIRLAIMTPDTTGVVAPWQAVIIPILQSQIKKENWNNINSDKSFTD